MKSSFIKKASYAFLIASVLFFAVPYVFEHHVTFLLMKHTGDRNFLLDGKKVSVNENVAIVLKKEDSSTLLFDAKERFIRLTVRKRPDGLLSSLERKEYRIIENISQFRCKAYFSKNVASESHVLLEYVDLGMLAYIFAGNINDKYLSDLCDALLY